MQNLKINRAYVTIVFFVLLAACTKQEHPFYGSYGSAVSPGSTVNSNVRIVSLCTVPGYAFLSQTASKLGPHAAMQYLLWDLQLNGKSMASSGIGAYSDYIGNLSRYDYSSNSNTNANPIPASPQPGGLLPGQPGTSTPANPGPIVKPFVLPDSVLDGNGRAPVRVNYVYSWYQYNQHLGDTAVTQFDTTLGNTAQDLYFYNTAFSTTQTSPINLVAKVFPRAVSVTDPSKFKVRIINLSHADNGSALPGGGRVSLCYANTLPVNTAVTSGIAPGQASDYVELPYGTYQFRLFDENTLQVPGSSSHSFIQSPAGNNYGYVQTLDGNGTTGIAYTPIRTYLPGGIYTLVVYDNLFFNGGNPTVAPNYSLVPDNNPPTNFTYSNIQWANGLPGASQATLQIDGQDLQGPLDFGGYSAYQSYTAGQHYLLLKDNGGHTLSSQSFNLAPMNNYTIWTYADAENKPQVLFVSNSMDFTNNGVQKSSDFTFACRFLNFCPDAANITFTTSNFNSNNNGVYPSPWWSGVPWGPSVDASSVIVGGASVPVKVYENLAFAQPVTDTPYLMPPYPGTSPVGSTFFPLYKLNAFISQASPTPIVPGEPIPGLLPLSLPFLDNPAIYPDPNKKPPSDAGLFSAALVGRIAPSDPSQNVRLMVIKHIQ